MAINKRAEKSSDLGFGTRLFEKGERRINQDGSVNVKRKGVPFFKRKGVYHWLLEMNWGQFALLLVSAYFTINLLFAVLYLINGVSELDGFDKSSVTISFWQCFFFSAQTLTTVGYGHISPVGIGAEIISSIEGMIGVLMFAMATGITYGRFAKPKANIRYSENCLIAPYQGGKAWMFRMVNQRDNQLIEVEVSVILTMVANTGADGGKRREFYPLTLERNSVKLFPLSWTVVHPIDEVSPMAGLRIEEMEELDAEFLIIVKAFDDNFSQTVYSRCSYVTSEIVQGAKFLNMLDRDEKGRSTVHIDRLNHFEKAALPDDAIAESVVKEENEMVIETEKQAVNQETRA